MKSKTLAALLACLAVSGTALAESTAGQKVDDAALVAKVKAELLRSRDVSGLAVNVDAKNGVVTLSGNARTDAERARAAELARKVNGVSKVENKIEIKAK